MALGVPGMHRKNPNLSLILPKIEQELAGKERNFGKNDVTSPKSQKSPRQDRMAVSFPSLTEDSNNNGIHEKNRNCVHERNKNYVHDRGTISTRYHNLHGNALHGSPPRKTVNLQLGKRGKLKLKKDENSDAFVLRREQPIDLSPSSNERNYIIQRESKVVNPNLTAKDSSRKNCNQAQKRVQNCSILGKREGESTQEKLYMELKRQEPIDVDRSIEIGSIKKCSVWMEMWFDEDGRPKLDTEDDIYSANEDLM